MIHDTSASTHTPGLLLQPVVVLVAVHCRNVSPRRAVERCISDPTHRQEMRPQPPNAQLGHVGQRLADTAPEQEAAQLLVETGHVQVPDEGLGADTSETNAVTLPKGNLEVHTSSELLYHVPHIPPHKP